MSQLGLKIILGAFIGVPLVIGLTKFNKADRVGRLFVLFIGAGSVVDTVMLTSIYFDKTRYLLLIFNVYSLLEALFFFWFVWATALSDFIRNIAKALLYLTLPLWILFIFIFPLLVKEISRSAAFDTTYYIITSFLAGFALLQLVENEKSVFTSSSFWFTLGIFFCSFCTFYIMTFLQTILANKIWFLNNVFNIISYAFYSLGFWYLKVKPISG